MVSIRDVENRKLLSVISEELKKKINMPEWALFVKTGASRERPPEQDDWWYLRAASLFRRIYNDGPVGVSRLRSYYGGSKNCGHAPSQFRKSSGKIIRTILQDLEKLGYVQKVEKPKRGRIVTSEGQKFLNYAAKQVK